MRELAEQFHQTVLLTKLMGNAVVCLEREEAREQYVRLSYERGSVLDINAGASALVLLAATPEDQVRGLLASTTLKQFTKKTLTDVDQIVERLAQVRADGYTVSSGEVDPTAMGIAAPIRRGNGDVIAGSSIVLNHSLGSKPQIDSIVEALVGVAASLSAQATLLEL